MAKRDVHVGIYINWKICEDMCGVCPKKFWYPVALASCCYVYISRTYVHSVQIRIPGFEFRNLNVGFWKIFRFDGQPHVHRDWGSTSFLNNKIMQRNISASLDNREKDSYPVLGLHWTGQTKASKFSYDTANMWGWLQWVIVKSVSGIWKDEGGAHKELGAESRMNGNELATVMMGDLHDCNLFPWKTENGIS